MILSFRVFKELRSKSARSAYIKNLALHICYHVFLLKLSVKDAEILYVKSKKQKSLTVNQKNVKYLCYTIKKYQLIGIKPPVSIFVELKMAKFLAGLEWRWK